MLTLRRGKANRKEIQPKLLDSVSVYCDQAHLWVTRASDEEQSDPEGRSLVNRCQATPCTPVLQREPARSLCKHMLYIYVGISLITAVLHWSAQVRQKWLQTENTHPHPYRASKSDKIRKPSMIEKYIIHFLCFCRSLVLWVDIGENAKRREGSYAMM